MAAQNKYYKTALAEIKGGHKRGHWMWFVFPQIKGLGRSDISKYYAIQSRREAREYLKHPVLGRRLAEISEALLDLKTNDPYEVFGWPDNMKLHASMTLFFLAGRCEVFGDVLVKYFGGELNWETIKMIQRLDG